MEEKIEIENGLKITDYSKDKSELYIKFERKSVDDDPNNDLQFNGSCFEFKFKDPRDALKELVKNWKVYDLEISSKLLDYVNYGISLGNFNPMQVYYNIILNFQIEYTIYFAMHNTYLPEIKEDRLKEAEDLYNVWMNKYLVGFNIISRVAHKWAIANTWWYYNYYNRKTLIKDKDRIPNTLNLYNGNFSEDYNGKKVVEVTNFLFIERLWRVKFEDNSWIIAFDAGNGWYKPLTNFNSYKINIPYQS